jgi:spore coat polysaccharide biosynthesis protein SpsF
LIASVITARMGSTRLPGKALADICGKPMLWHIINRLKKSKHINKIIIATDKKSKPIVDFAEQNEIDCYAGADTDILDRIYQASKGADVIVQVWGDCPFINPKIVDGVIEFFLKNKCDYAYNTKCPEGQMVAVISRSAWEKAWRQVKNPKDREWTHPYFVNSSFRVKTLEAEDDWSAVKLTVDTPQDLDRARKLYEKMRFR